MATQCFRCLVSGRVQGVFFRASTRNMARELGLYGYAKNLPDGRVEVVICGDSDGVDQMRDWLWLGPDSARVTDVACEVLEGVSFDRFATS